MFSWDNGSVYSPKILDISTEDLKTALMGGIQSVAAFSLATGYLTAPAVPHMIINGFKNIVAVGVATEYSFPQGDKIKEMLKNPGAFAAGFILFPLPPHPRLFSSRPLRF